MAEIAQINDRDIAILYERIQRTGQATLTGKQRRDEVSKREAELAEKERIHQLERCGIFTRYQDSTFSAIEARGIPDSVKSQYADLQQWVAKLCEHLKTGEGLILRGHVGTMKTTFAVAALHELIRQGGSGFFITMPSLIDTIFTLKEKNSDEWLGFERKLRESPLLVLDDLGAEYPTGWVLHKVDAIISERYNRCRPIIITTNLSGEQMKSTYAERIIDRWRSTCRIITFTGDSLRKTVSA
jgi:DNA replication protein DnaC